MQEKYYYTIGEVAEILGTSTSQLRYWSGEFNMNVRKNRKGERLFQKGDLVKLKRIQKLLKDEGFTIDGAKKKIKSMSNYDLIEIETANTSGDKSVPVIEPHQKTLIISQLRNIQYNLNKLKLELETA